MEEERVLTTQSVPKIRIQQLPEIRDIKTKKFINHMYSSPKGDN